MIAIGTTMKKLGRVACAVGTAVKKIAMQTLVGMGGGGWPRAPSPASLAVEDDSKPVSRAPAIHEWTAHADTNNSF